MAIILPVMVIVTIISAPTEISAAIVTTIVIWATIVLVATAIRMIIPVAVVVEVAVMPTTRRLARSATAAVGIEFTNRQDLLFHLVFVSFGDEFRNHFLRGME